MAEARTHCPIRREEFSNDGTLIINHTWPPDREGGGAEEVKAMGGGSLQRRGRGDGISKNEEEGEFLSI